MSIFHVPIHFQNDSIYPSLYMDEVQFHEFMVVCRYMYIHFVNLIVTQQSGETPLHHAARSGNAQVVNALLKAGSKADEKDVVSML